MVPHDYAKAACILQVLWLNAPSAQAADNPRGWGWLCLGVQGLTHRDAVAEGFNRLRRDLRQAGLKRVVRSSRRIFRALAA